MSKHIVVISDGDPTPPSPSVINQLAASKITVTAVLTAAHGNDPGATPVMRNLAKQDQGPVLQRHQPQGAAADLPEGGPVDLAAADLRADDPLAAQAQLSDHRAGHGPIPSSCRPITGLVLTSPKENELVEIPIVSPLPTGQFNPVLAHWTYGLGRSVAFTSDAGRRWAKAWPDWRSYAAFWSQVIRWSMRPADRGNLTLNVRREQGRIKVVVDALDKNNEFLNFLQIQGNVVNPDLKSSTVELVQTAPGRYEATIENAEASGNYFVNLGYRGPDNVQGVISSGVSVPYSDEYRELRSNPTTLETLATLTDGKVVSWKTTPDGRLTCRTSGSDHFRRDPGLINPRSFARSVADAALAGGLPVPGRRRRPPDRARRGLDQAGGRQRMAEATRSGAGDRERLHGQAAKPQGRGRRAARPHPRGSRPRASRASVPDALPPVPSASRFWKGERSWTGPEPPRKRRAPASRHRRQRPRSKATPTACSRPSSASGRNGRKTRSPTRKTPLHEQQSSVRAAWPSLGRTTRESATNFIVAFRSETVIFSELGLILYSIHDLISCIGLASRVA